MPTNRADEALAQKLTNGTKSSPRKRKQEPEDDAAVLSTPPKASKRVKREALSPLNGSPIKNESAIALKSKSKSNNQATETVDLEADGQVDGEVATKKTPRKRTTKVERGSDATFTEVKEEAGTPSVRKTKSVSEATETVDLERDEQVDAEAPKKTRRKRKTKEEKEAEAMPVAARTNGLRMFIGAHVSIATGVEKAVTNCVHIGYSFL